ncbi:MAG: hypothetical protein CM15mP85_24850 [Rhodobacterales bacterium]|nr:MAG: hypothetical protein CM15mP85_24850 [Rhodobacterales bacterium]
MVWPGVVTVHQSINNGVIPDCIVASNLMIDKSVNNKIQALLHPEKLKKRLDKIMVSYGYKLGYSNFG